MNADLDFHRQSQRVTRVVRQGVIRPKYTIKIDDQAHCMALLAASCLELSSVATNG